ncbi:MAG: Nif3-like dinuclear metal center hexameric protein [Bacteroidota bacterium]
MPLVRTIIQALEAWAPAASAQSYDQVGLQVGRADQEIDRGLIALDLTEDVVQEAAAQGAQVIITHHPLLFKPLRRVTPQDASGHLVLKLAQADIAYYAIHTNLDAAHGGVSFALARQLGLEQVSFLAPEASTLCKLVVFVPLDHVDRVREALGQAGAGHLGAYAECAFTVQGTGTFRPLPQAQPFIGEAGGGLERVAEARLETVVPRWSVQRAVAAMRAAHPYEEVAYDVYPVEQPTPNQGLGAIGVLPEAEALPRFLSRVATALDTSILRYVGADNAMVQRVAVCGGSGSSLIGQAKRAGADAYVTADITYHSYFEALTPSGRPQMALVNAGHYETEAITETLLVDWLTERFPTVAWARTQHRTSPVRSFVRDP